MRRIRPRSRSSLPSVIVLLCILVLQYKAAYAQESVAFNSDEFSFAEPEARRFIRRQPRKRQDSTKSVKHRDDLIRQQQQQQTTTTTTQEKRKLRGRYGGFLFQQFPIRPYGSDGRNMVLRDQYNLDSRDYRIGSDIFTRGYRDSYYRSGKGGGYGSNKSKSKGSGKGAGKGGGYGSSKSKSRGAGNGGGIVVVYDSSQSRSRGPERLGSRDSPDEAQTTGAPTFATAVPTIATGAPSKTTAAPITKTATPSAQTTAVAPTVAVTTATPSAASAQTTAPSVPQGPQGPPGCSICSDNAYNCADFATQEEAQACHDYCFALVGSDVHDLDRESDGIACESLPSGTFTQTPAPSFPQGPQEPQGPQGCSICSENAYNCADFATQQDAQACHDYCFALVGSDVHDLDRESDGIACESLP